MYTFSRKFINIFLLDPVCHAVPQLGFLGPWTQLIYGALSGKFSDFFVFIFFFYFFFLLVALLKYCLNIDIIFKTGNITIY
jgi:hypothetical protein